MSEKCISRLLYPGIEKNGTIGIDNSNITAAFKTSDFVAVHTYAVISSYFDLHTIFKVKSILVCNFKQYLTNGDYLREYELIRYF